MTTKARGNIVQVATLDTSAGAGRLLSNDMCFATTSISASEQDRIWDEFLRGDSLVYNIMGDNEMSSTGQVRYVSGYMAGVTVHDTIDSAHRLFPGHFYEESSEPATSAGAAWLDRAETILQEDEECCFFEEIECEVCPRSETEMFYMICCGTVDHALFISGNCCIQSHQDSDERRRLGKCTTSTRGFFRQPGRNPVRPKGED